MKASKATKALNQIRLALDMEIKLEQIKLENGVVIEAESFEQGQNVFVLAEDGEKLPLPAGEYQLEGGSVLTVVDEGVIASIGEPQEKEEEIENQDMETVATPKKTVETVSKEQHFSDELQLSDETIAVIAEKVLSIIESKLESAKEEDGAKAEVKEEVKEELSKVETKEIEVVKHSPETQVKSAPMKFATKRVKTVKDRVFAKMFV